MSMDSTSSFPFSDASEDGGEQHPPSFYCPISTEVMHDPVVLSDGHSYERRHIETWLGDRNTSPKTGAVLPSNFMFPNHALRNSIEEYFSHVFSVHRMAIRRAVHQSPRSNLASHRFSSNSSLMKTVDSLMKMSLVMNADRSAEWVLRSIIDEAKMLVGAEVASVFLVDEANQELYSTINSTAKEIRIPLTHGIAGHVATTGEVVNIQDAYQDERFNQAVDKRTGFRTLNILCVPIKTKKGRVIGVANLINKTEGGVTEPAALPDDSPRDASAAEAAAKTEVFSTEDEKFLVVFAAQAAAAIANAALALQPRQAGLSNPLRALESARAQRAQQKLREGGAESGGGGGEGGVSLSGGDPIEAEATPPGPSHVLDLSPEVSRLLEASLTSWHMDALSLTDLTGGHPLSALGCFLLERTGLTDAFHLDRPALRRFFGEMDAGYAPPGETPYHNNAHAASVLHMTHALLSQGCVLSTVSTWARDNSCGEGWRSPGMTGRLEALSLLVAASVHDFEHLGVTNPFLVATRHPRALLYNDLHVNESHHVASAFKLLHSHSKGCDFTKALGKEARGHFRKLVIDLVLATDMAEDKRIVTALSAVLTEPVKLRQSLTDAIARGRIRPVHGPARRSTMPSLTPIAPIRQPSVEPSSAGAALAGASPGPSPFTEAHRRSNSVSDVSDPKSPDPGAARSQTTGPRQSSISKPQGEGPEESQGLDGPTGMAAEEPTEAAPSMGAAPGATPPRILSPNRLDPIAGFRPGSEAEGVLALQVVIKAADLGHLALPWDQHLTWVKRLEEEFFAQGDMEKQLLPDSPVSFLMDREKPGVTKTQLGFFQFVVDPLFKTLGNAFPGASPMVAAVAANRERWSELEKPTQAT